MLPSCGMKKAFITLAEVRVKWIGTPAGTTRRFTLATFWSGWMNSHFQSSDTTWTLCGSSFDNGFAGSRSCDPIQATLPSSMIVSRGMDQVMSSILPDSTKLGSKSARLLDDRYHHPNMSDARIVGTTIGSMMMNASIRSDVVPSATTPLGWRTISCSQPPSASNASMAPQRRTTAAGDRPLNRGRGLNTLPERDSNGIAIFWPPEATAPAMTYDFFVMPSHTRFSASVPRP